ncbi:hypothetical protein [Photobacterium sp. 53610]|uniref:hypothetical protein n=1 Tax=Photobacterium sp. 53610 TaxID=3102789 RepID=UPI002EDA247B
MMKKLIFSIFTLWSLFIATETYASEKQQCSEASKSILTRDLSKQGIESNEFDAIACKVLPNNHQKILASYLKNLTHYNGGDRFLWRVVLIDQLTGKVVSSYSDEVQEDGGIRVNEYSIKLDTARYNLNDKTRAVGVRLMIGTSPRCADFFMSDYLSLFVEKYSDLVPVILNLPTNIWESLQGEHCEINNDTLISKQSNVFISMLKHQTNDYNDIRITTKVKKETLDQMKDESVVQVKNLYKTVRFDGKTYELNP